MTQKLHITSHQSVHILAQVQASVVRELQLGRRVDFKHFTDDGLHVQRCGDDVSAVWSQTRGVCWKGALVVKADVRTVAGATLDLQSPRSADTAMHAEHGVSVTLPYGGDDGVGAV